MEDSIVVLISIEAVVVEYVDNSIVEPVSIEVDDSAVTVVSAFGASLVDEVGVSVLVSVEADC